MIGSGDNMIGSGDNMIESGHVTNQNLYHLIKNTLSLITETYKNTVMIIYSSRNTSSFFFNNWGNLKIKAETLQQ